MPKNKKITIKTEVVNGKCPTCDQFTMMVNIDVVFFRCMSCGSDLEPVSYTHLTLPTMFEV